MNTQKTIDRHIIWSNVNLDLDDWRDDMKEQLSENGYAPDEITEDRLYEEMLDTNYSYLDDERINLNIQEAQPIIVIADLGRWNGRFQGYKMIESGNIKDCLYSDTDYTEWYVDKLGDLRADAIHHDGTNHYLYRAFKDGTTPEQIERLQDKIYSRIATRSDITRVTKRLGDDIGKVYGWNFPKQNKSREQAR